MWIIERTNAELRATLGMRVYAALKHARSMTKRGRKLNYIL